MAETAVKTEVERAFRRGGVMFRRAKNSLLCKELAHLSVTQLTSFVSPIDDSLLAGGLKKTQGGGESRQKQ